MSQFLHPRMRATFALAELLVIAAVAGAESARWALRKRRKAQLTRRPGLHTPLWNVCATRLRRALRRRGAKAKRARYLGIPRQRRNDYLKVRSRLPDAEILLRMLHWLAAQEAGRDLAL